MRIIWHSLTSVRTLVNSDLRTLAYSDLIYKKYWLFRTSFQRGPNLPVVKVRIRQAPN